MTKVTVGDRSLRMQPLWVRVDANRTKLAAFVAAFVFGSALLLSLAMVAVPGGIVGAVLASEVAGYWTTYAIAVFSAFGLLLLLGSLIAAVQLANAEDWVRNRFGGHSLAQGEAPELERVIADMTIAAGLPAQPAILVLADTGTNAFAIGTARGRATIGVTQGMLAQYTPDELRAVVATLCARIVAGDIMFATALAALMGPIKAIRESRRAAGNVADATAQGCVVAPDDFSDGCGCLADGIGDSDDFLGGALMVLFIVVVAAVTYAAVVTAAWIVTLWGRALNRTSYEKADAEGMLLLKNPQPMIMALRKSIRSSTCVADGDQSYDGIFYASTSGTPAVERVERRRFNRLCEVLGVDGMAATLDAPDVPR